MKRNLRAQMVGFHHPCIFIQDHQNHDYYEFLHEADEFGAAAGTYPTEREELLANSAHRYQLLVDWTSQQLKLNVSFLNQGKNLRTSFARKIKLARTLWREKVGTDTNVSPTPCPT